MPRALPSLLLLALFAPALVGCHSLPEWGGPHHVRDGRITVISDVSPQLAREVHAEARSFLTDLDRWLGGEPDREPLTIYLFSSYDEFQKVMRARGEGITYYGGQQPLVGVPLWPLELDERSHARFLCRVVSIVGADWRHRLRHELVHVRFRKAEGLDRDWLWEGIADTLAHGGPSLTGGCPPSDELASDDAPGADADPGRVIARAAHAGASPALAGRRSREVGGRGLKSQRFLTLKAAWREGRLRSFRDLRRMTINAARPDAELLYAEAWSLVYTLLRGGSTALAQDLRAWLRAGAPGSIETILARHRVATEEVDRRRRELIAGGRCLIELGPVHENSLLWNLGLREGDEILQLGHHGIGTIQSKRQLGTSLSLLLHPPRRHGEVGPLRCVFRSSRGLQTIGLPAPVVTALDWRLAVRRVTPDPLLDAETPPRRGPASEPEELTDGERRSAATRAPTPPVTSDRSR